MIKQVARYKQMSLETAIRNPERYKDILSALLEFEHKILNDENLLQIVSNFYQEGIVSITGNNFDKLSEADKVKLIRVVNSTRRADGGFPSGYQSRFWTYMRTLSEFGFVYAEYNKPLIISAVAKLLVENKIDDQIAFATQSAIYNRKSPFRNVSNDFNFFRFITYALMKLSESGRGLTYEQFILSLFSENGNVDDFLLEIKNNSFSDEKAVFKFVVQKYGAKNKLGTITRDYPDAVLRLLKITGFVSIKYSSKISIVLNIEKKSFIEKIFSDNYEFSNNQKNSKIDFFTQYNKWSIDLLKITASWVNEDKTESFNKLRMVVDTYKIDLIQISKMIKDLQVSRDKSFKYVPDPLKLEFYISILLFLVYGDSYSVVPNFKTDSLGMPISHAPGNQGDIFVYSDSIYWLIEVTLIRNKQQQLNSETTSVIRHLGDDTREKFLSFVAPFVHQDTALFYENSIMNFIKDRKLVYLKAYSINDFLVDTTNKSNLETMKYNYNSVLNLLKSRFLG